MPLTRRLVADHVVPPLIVSYASLVEKSLNNNDCENFFSLIATNMGYKPRLIEFEGAGAVARLPAAAAVRPEPHLQDRAEPQVSARNPIRDCIACCPPLLG